MNSQLSASHFLCGFLAGTLAAVEGAGAVKGRCDMSGPSSPRGDLTVYGSESQIGTIARREFIDEHGRRLIVVYYRLASNATAGRTRPVREEEITEDQLVVQQISLLDYDSQGRLVREERSHPNGTIATLSETEYNAQGQKVKTVTLWAGFQGARKYETLFRGRSSTTRVFDQDDHLITVVGDVGANEAPPGGWGEPKEGFALHLTATPSRGRPVQIRLALTLLDRTNRQAASYVAVFPHLELRDAHNDLRAPTAQYAVRVRNYLQSRGSKSSGPCDTRMWLAAPDGAWEMDLQETYGELPEGRYSLVAGSCLDGSGATSNVVDLVIEPQSQQ